MGDETFLAAVFNKLSLAERREVWESKEDTEEATMERINLLWGQKETDYSKEMAARYIIQICSTNQRHNSTIETV